MHIVIVTGLSGAGKSTALRALEDYGFFCVDNMPLPVASQLVDWISGNGHVGQLAIAVDARQHEYLDSYRQELDRLVHQGHKVDVLYLDASDECLVRRFSTTRRRHPLSRDDLVEGISRDRQIMAELRGMADVIDTETLNPHQLKALIQDRYGHGEGTLSVVMLSFGFKHGLPREANLVFDVRFLRNPYFDPELTEHDGRDPRVASYVLDTPEAKSMLEHIETLLRFALPQFQREGKLYLTVAVGCTGGRHRSVAMVEELCRRMCGDWDALVKHRDLDLRT
ncbi:MAG: RNase adapter RapZ [Proteobacteria bacterium]|nr:RNase adapter RapZ [Pseudomonadota bacterium]